MKFGKLPFLKIAVAGAAATGGIYVLGQVANYRADRIAKGESDPLAFANNLPGGAAIPVALGFTAASGLLLKGNARNIGYMMAAGALIPAGQSLIMDAQARINEPVQDHYLSSGSRALTNAQMRYSNASRAMSKNMLNARALAS